MNKNTIRRICDSVEDKPWKKIRIVPAASDKSRVGILLEDMGYEIEDKGSYFVVNTQYTEDTARTIRDTLDKASVGYRLTEQSKVSDVMQVEGFEQLRETVGDTAIVDELKQYMSTDDLEEFVDHLMRAFDME